MGGFSYDRNDYDDSSSSGWGSSSSYSPSSSYSAKSYDRNDYDDSSSSGWGSSSSYSPSSSYSAKADKKMGARCLDNKMKADKRVKSGSKNPIVICLDVTGSNIDFAKIVYDKMPMFYGQIEEQGYLDDFDICFMACGDANSDRYPLQVCNFEKGVKIDEWLESIVLESGGGGQKKETYEKIGRAHV